MAMSLTLPAALTLAATAYVSDELVLGMYAEPNGQGQRLATLHSGASVETLEVSGEFTQVRLADGSTGWVKSASLNTQVPPTVRLKQLQEELDRSRATTPALAEAAARSELEQLKIELKNKQSELDAAHSAAGAPLAASGLPAIGMAVAGSAAQGGGTGLYAAAAAHPWMGITALLAALACGFWLGYATLARRVRQKFGGIKVY